MPAPFQSTKSTSICHSAPAELVVESFLSAVEVAGVQFREPEELWGWLDPPGSLLAFQHRYW